LQDYTTEINGEEVTIRCTHADLWPPVYVDQGDPEAMRAAGTIDNHIYEQIKTWERVCGLHEMADSCLSCPLALNADTDKALSHKSDANSYRPPFARKGWGRKK